MNQDKKVIIGVNLGSTSSEAGVLFPDGKLIKKKLSHGEKELALPVSEQVGFRFKAIHDWLLETGVNLSACAGVACRGGRLSPIPSGVYPVNEQLLEDSRKTADGDHAARLSVSVGMELAGYSGCPVFVVDPISVDEFDDVARISGLSGVERKSLGHALNAKYVARNLAQHLGKSYETTRLLIAHIGGGATISLHINGKMVDLINDFEGAFTPERSGALPMTEMLKLCADNSIQTVSKWVEGYGGIYSYLHTKRFDVLEEKAMAGDHQCRLLLKAYVYQQKKSLGALLAAADFKIDGAALTGGIAHSPYVTRELTKTLSLHGPVQVYPGSFEMEALIERTQAALIGDQEKREYPSGRIL